MVSKCGLVVVVSLVCPALGSGQQSHTVHDRHRDGSEANLRERGRLAMGFDQDRTTHRFLVRSDGGVITVDVNDPTDDTNRQAIRVHLRRIAVDFAERRFDAPLATHGEEPPGMRTLKALAGSISYSVEETAKGARVRITSKDAKAIAAIHAFLRYQIREHRTGDPLG